MAAINKPTMSEDHKEALAVGRAEGRLVRAYLDALDSIKPKRGRKRTKEAISNRLDHLERELSQADALKKLQLTQEQIDLTNELEKMDNAIDLTELEGEFLRVAKGYANRKGISYEAFRKIGVPASTLKKAGIKREE